MNAIVGSVKKNDKVVREFTSQKEYLEYARIMKALSKPVQVCIAS